MILIIISITITSASQVSSDSSFELSQGAAPSELESDEFYHANVIHGALGAAEIFHFCYKPWVSGFTSKEGTAPCGRLVMLLDHSAGSICTVGGETGMEMWGAGHACEGRGMRD